MKAFFPISARIAGYLIIAIGLFLPILMMMSGHITDRNLLLYKECAKLLMIIGAVMIIFAQTAHENAETEGIRNRAVRNAIFLTVIYLFLGMMYRLSKGDLQSIDSSSFVIFLVWNVLCLEFGLQKSKIDKLFHRGKKDDKE